MRGGIDWSRVQRPEKNPLGPSSDVSGVWGNRENTGNWDNEGTVLSFRDGTYVFTRWIGQDQILTGEWEREEKRESYGR
jgi:hypothetical protein